MFKIRAKTVNLDGAIKKKSQRHGLSMVFQRKLFKIALLQAAWQNVIRDKELAR